MNRGLNLPSIQRIMNEFEKESSMMDMKEEMMSDAVDDVMDDEEEEEEEGDKILKEVLDEIGVDLSQQVHFTSCFPAHRSYSLITANRRPYWHNGSIVSPSQQTTSSPRGTCSCVKLYSPQWRCSDGRYFWRWRWKWWGYG